MSEPPVSYVARGERTSPKWCAAFAAGCGGDMATDGKLRPGPVALFGSPKLWPPLLQAQAEGRDWYYGDHGFFGRGTYYRIAKNAYQHDGAPDGDEVDYARLERLQLAIAPWQKSGRHVLVCPPDERFAKLHGFKAAIWTKNVIETLKRHTDRPIILRPRLGTRAPLAVALSDCWALVTYSSNAAVEAVLAGVPVFCTARCGASYMARTDLSRIEDPLMLEGREKWAATLAANQWTLEEIEAGMAWERLR